MRKVSFRCGIQLVDWAKQSVGRITCSTLGQEVVVYTDFTGVHGRVGRKWIKMKVHRGLALGVTYQRTTTRWELILNFMHLLRVTKRQVVGAALSGCGLRPLTTIGHLPEIRTGDCWMWYAWNSLTCIASRRTRLVEEITQTDLVAWPRWLLLLLAIWRCRRWGNVALHAPHNESRRVVLVTEDKSNEKWFVSEHHNPQASFFQSKNWLCLVRLQQATKLSHAISSTHLEVTRTQSLWLFLVWLAILNKHQCRTSVQAYLIWRLRWHNTG